MVPSLALLWSQIIPPPFSSKVWVLRPLSLILAPFLALPCMLIPSHLHLMHAISHAYEVMPLADVHSTLCIRTRGFCGRVVVAMKLALASPNPSLFLLLVLGLTLCHSQTIYAGSPFMQAVRGGMMMQRFFRRVSVCYGFGHHH